IPVADRDDSNLKTLKLKTQNTVERVRGNSRQMSIVCSTTARARQPHLTSFLFAVPVRPSDRCSANLEDLDLLSLLNSCLWLHSFFFSLWD
ncbi:MAG: hypothetical protein AAFR67_04930, partial [Chloroflexota bacterium]